MENALDRSMTAWIGYPRSDNGFRPPLVPEWCRMPTSPHSVQSFVADDLAFAPARSDGGVVVSHGGSPACATPFRLTGSQDSRGAV
jgi:hypothetical protein